MGSGERGRIAWTAATAFAVSAAFALLVVSAAGAGVGGDWARRASDILWPTGAAHPGVVVVAVDARSQDAVGPWPWTRDTQADLVRAIAEAGAGAIGYDVIVGADASAEGPAGLFPVDGTDRLAQALSSAPSVVATGFTSVVRGDRGVLVGSQPLAPDARIADAGTIGHTVVPADGDGTTRTIPLVVETPAGTFVPAFALALAAAGDSSASADLILRPGAVQYAGLTVPVEAGAALRISWADGLSSGSPAIVSAADVLDGSVDPALLAGAHVLVGVADATIGDTHISPMQPGATTPGVVIQAQAVSTILARAWVTPAAWWSAGLAVLLLGAIVAGVAVRRSPWVAALITLAAVIGWVVVAVFALPLGGLQLDLVRVPLALVGCAVVGGAVRLVREQRDRQRAVGLFARYVPDAVARRLLDRRGERALDEGVRLDAAVLFCDLRDFTPLAATLEPDEVRRALDVYYSYACDRIFAAGGTVMQFVGDEVFAVFGAPEAMERPADAAIAAARAIVDDRPELEGRLADAALPSLSYGIGVHAGQLVAAAVGAEDRRQYAVVGDVVNVGSRLCGSAAAGEIVVSAEALRDAAETALGPGGVVSDIELLSVKGKSAPIEVHRIRAVPADR